MYGRRQHISYIPCLNIIDITGGKVYMADGDSTGSNAIWAVALIIIVALIVGVVYYSGVLKNAGADKKVDINVSAPAR